MDNELVMAASVGMLIGLLIGSLCGFILGWAYVAGVG